MNIFTINENTRFIWRILNLLVEKLTNGIWKVGHSYSRNKHKITSYLPLLSIAEFYYFEHQYSISVCAAICDKAKTYCLNI